MTKPCRCHSDESLYGSLSKCPACGHRSYDPGIGCERRKCAYVVPAEPTVKPNPVIECEAWDERDRHLRPSTLIAHNKPIHCPYGPLLLSMTTEAIKAHRRELGLGEWWE